MNANERRQYEMLVRVRDFGTAHGQLFPAATVAGETFAAVDAAIKELDAQELAHLAASVSARAQRKDTARQALLDRLQAIVQTARVLRHDDASLIQQFEVPAPASDQTLVNTGRKFARDAAALGPQFIAHGMPAAFIAELNALVDGFETALRDRGLGREARRAAGLRTKAALASGMDAVRRLDAIVTNHLTDDAVATALWERERRVAYPKRTDPAPGSEPAPAPVVPESPTNTKAA
jgi:hypothetical protein